MKIVHYPHPTLRHRSKPIARVDDDLRKMVREMFALMYEANGIGLAANQVDLPFRLFVANLAGKPDEGEELVFLNPVISKQKGNEEREEGCLSLPGVYAPVRRPDTIHLEAYGIDGSSIQADLDGMYARVVQHEVDHLDGVLFVDRLSSTYELQVQPELEELVLAHRTSRETGSIPDDDVVASRLRDLEARYC